MIVQFSTGRGQSQNEQGRMLYLKPDMASLATGSVNFPAQIYENPPTTHVNLWVDAAEEQRRRNPDGVLT